MKILLSWLACLLIFVPSTFAHEGYRSYITINGKNTIHNSVYSTSVEGFLLPHEAVTEDYLVLRELVFVIDPAKINRPLEEVKRMKFAWDFGDGEKVEGGRATHTYKKIGTFVASLYGKLDENPEQVLTTIKLNILPLQNYKLPQAGLSINGKMFPDSQPKVIQPFTQKFVFEAQDIGTSSAQIVEYLWDLGDKSSANEKRVEHTFADDHFGANIILRIKDRNGFWTDQSIQLVNQDRQGVENQSAPPKTLFQMIGIYRAYLIVFFLGLLVLVGGIFWVYCKKILSKRS